MDRNRIVFLLLLFIGSTVWAQLPELTGIGLSGAADSLDALVMEGDTLYVVAAYTPQVEWDVEAPALDESMPGVIAVHVYSDSALQEVWLETYNLGIDPASVTLDTLVEPALLRFRVPLRNIIDPFTNSLQVEFGLLVRHELQGSATSTRYTSHVPAGDSQPLNDAVDDAHMEFLFFRDIITHPIEIVAPAPGSIVPNQFEIVYNQAEDAKNDSTSLVLLITREDINTEPQRVLFLRNLRAGNGNLIRLNTQSLWDPQQFIGQAGTAPLTHGGRYRFVLSYRDINENPFVSDTLRNVLLDQFTESVTLYEPRAGSTTPDSSIHVAYALAEQADTLWITFTELADSNFQDPNSPHILTIVPAEYGPGLHSFYLTGNNIGTGSPYVLENNRGTEDRLQTRVAYRVTLSYGDLAGNVNASYSNDNYVWPRDEITTRPVVTRPRRTSAQNASLWVEFILPEAPLPGSVKLLFAAVPDTADPASPHIVYLSTTVAGRTAVFLDATQFAASDLVDSVRGDGTDAQNNMLVTGLRYNLRVAYRDSLGNPEAESFVNPFTYDNVTTPITITAPAPGDTLRPTDVPVIFTQPEAGLFGSLQLILTQTGGPEVDLGSPHTLYLTHVGLGVDKTLLLEPASLLTTLGVDSVTGGPSLAPRGLYRLTMQYRDSLGNAPTPVHVDNLYYPSGTQVYASGNRVGDATVMPGDYRNVAFRLALRTDGGQSALRGLRFSTQGEAQPADIYAPQVWLWSSVDTTFSEDVDTTITRLMEWRGGDMVFDSFLVPLSGNEINLFVTLFFPDQATAGRRLNMYLAGPSAIDCGGDPVFTERWPIGTVDVALDVSLVDFVVEPDSAFGSLRLEWIVASETDNAGFRIFRRAESEEEFVPVAGWNTHSELVGRGTSPSAGYYSFVDRGLAAGQRYFYRLAAESYTGAIQEFDLTAEGIPAAPPADFALGDAFPNPFNQEVHFTYVVPYTARVKIIIYDTMGRQVRLLFDNLRAAAVYRGRWDGRDDRGIALPSGVYFYRLQGGSNFFETKKFLLVR